MSDTTKITKDDDDIDIYSELPNFKYDENLLKLEGDNKALKTTLTELTKKIETLEIQLKACEKTNANYRRNISMLFLSAKREIERKDRTISELRSRSLNNLRNARFNFPRRNRSEAADKQDISEGEKTKSAPVTSETPTLAKKTGYCFTAGNTRSGLYKCNYPAKDSRTVASTSSGRSDSMISVKKIDGGKIVLPSAQVSNSKEISSKVVNSSRTVTSSCTIELKSEFKASSSNNNDSMKDYSKEIEGKEEKVGRGLLVERRSSITQDRRKSPITSNKRKTTIASVRSKSPITSDRRKSLRTSVGRDMDNKSSKTNRKEHLRSGSITRRRYLRSGSIRSSSRISNTVRQIRNRDSVDRVVGSSQKSPAREKEKLTNYLKLGFGGQSEVKSASESKTIEDIESVISDRKITAPVIISKEIDSNLSIDRSEINVSNHVEAMLILSEEIPVNQSVEVVNSIESSEKSAIEAVNDEKSNEHEELERIQSLPPLIGPWTQFSVRRYKKLHGFSPVKPDKEKKKIVNIKCIEKKNLFNNTIEKIVLTDIEGETTKEILNFESDKDKKGSKTNKIFESSSEGETTNEILNIQSDNDSKGLESSKILESSSALVSCALTDHDSSNQIPNNQKHESKLQNLPDVNRETLSKTVVIPRILNSNKENQSETEVVSLISSSDNQNPTDLDLESKTDISNNKTSSELKEISDGNVTAPSSCFGNDKSNELASATCTDIHKSQLSVSDREEELLRELVADCGISIIDSNTSDVVTDSVKETVKDIDSCMNERGVNDNKLEPVLEMGENCHVYSKSEGDLKNIQDTTKIGEDIVNINATNVNCQLQMGNDDNRTVESGSKSELCESRNESQQLKLITENADNEKIVEENRNESFISGNLLLASSRGNKDRIEENKTCSRTSISIHLQSSSENEVLRSGMEGQDKDGNVEQLDDEEIHTTAKEQEIVESNHLKEILITDSGLNAFEKSDSPEIDESPTSKLTVEKPKIIDNISSSLHTFNSALDFSISTTNTNSLNADSNIDQQRQKAQLSASSLQVVNALKKLPKIRENFLQLFGESSNQENLKDSDAGTPSEENNRTRAASAASKKELKMLSCSSSSSSSSSTSSSASSLITQEQSIECTIPPVIRLFGIDITEEHSPFHVCKSSSQNSVVEDKIDAISHSTVKDAENNLKTTTDDNPILENPSDITTGKSDSVEVIGKVLEKKTTEIAQITMESKKIYETKIVDSSVVQEQHCYKEKAVISKEIICEEPVVVPIIVIDKASDGKSMKSVSSQSKECKVTGYSNFTEALRKETNVSISKTELPQPDFQFESPSRYMMRINNNSVTSHKGWVNTESQSITGEDTLTMVRRLAKPLDTISPIKTPSNCTGSRNPRPNVSPDDVVSSGLVESKNKEEQCEKQLVESDRSSKKVEQSKTVAREENKPNLHIIAKKDKVSVSLSSEHFEFKRRRASRPIVKLKKSTDCLESKNDDLHSPKSVSNQPDEQKVGKQPTTPSRNSSSQGKQCFSSPRNDPIQEKLSPIQEKQPVSSPRNGLTQEKSPLPPRNVSIQGKQPSLRNDPIQRKQPPSPRNDPIQRKQPPPRNDPIQRKQPPSPRNDPIQRKRPPSPSRNDPIQGTQRFKRRRVVLNRLAKNDVIKLGSTHVEKSMKDHEQISTDCVKNREPIASTSGIGQKERLSVSSNSSSSVKRMNEEKESGLAKQQKVDKNVSADKYDDLEASAKCVNETRTFSHHRQRNEVAVSETTHAKPIKNVVDNIRSSKRGGVIDLKTDFCERRSPSEYFNRSMNRRYRGLLRDRKLQRCRSPFIARRRVDKYLMKMRETRERSVTMSSKRSSRVAERSVKNERDRNPPEINTDYCIEWKLKLIDFKLQKKETLFERLVAENILEKLEKPRTFIIDNPMESTPPPLPCHNDSRILVDQSNRSNQLLSPEPSHCAPSSNPHSGTPKSTNNIPETSTSEISSPKKVPPSNKIVIIRRRLNNSPKVLGDSVGTFIKTNNTQINSSSNEQNSPRAIIIRRERSNVSSRKLEDSPGCHVLDKSAKLTSEKASASNSCNENQGNGSKNELKNCEVNSREIVGSTVGSKRIVKTQLDFRSRLRRNRK